MMLQQMCDAAMANDAAQIPCKRCRYVEMLQTVIEQIQQYTAFFNVCVSG